jgi:hypothetical protein
MPTLPRQGYHLLLQLEVEYYVFPERKAGVTIHSSFRLC